MLGGCTRSLSALLRSTSTTALWPSTASLVGSALSQAPSKHLHAAPPVLQDSEGSSSASPKRIFVKRLGQSGPSADFLILGLMDYYKRVTPDVGYFKPVGTFRDAEGVPLSVSVVHKAFKMKDDPHSMYAMSEDSAYQMLADGKNNEVLEACYQKLHQYEQGKELVIINGWGMAGFRFNAQLAAHLDAPVLLTTEYMPGESEQMVYDRVMAEVGEYQRGHSQIMGVTVHSVPDHIYDRLHDMMKRRMAEHNIGYLGTYPEMPLMSTVTLDQIYDALKGRLLFSSLSDIQLGQVIEDIFIVTPHCGTMLDQLSERTRPLLVTTPDRVDTICTSFAAHTAGVAPLSGIVITGHDGTPSPYRRHLRGIFEGLARWDAAQSSKQYQLPVFMTDLPTYEAIKTMNSIKPAILPTSTAKIEASIYAFKDHVDGSALERSLANITPKLTPSKFIHGIYERCVVQPQRIVLPESSDHRVLEAAALAHRKGYARPVLLGRREAVLQEASKVGVDLEGVDIIDPENDERLDFYIDELVEARKKKGLTRESATDMLKDGNYFGTMMVKTEDADGLVSGAAHTTAATIRPGMQVLKDPDMPLISSIFFMCLPDKVLVYGDCAVNVDPDPQQLAYIAIASADTARAFGIDPRVAMLSYSTLGSGSGPQVEKVTEAVRIARELRPDIRLDGPMQYDAATNPRIATVKVKEDKYKVAGQATVLVFPDLNTGNNTYKAVQQASGGVAMGPLMQGLSGAVNDLSRGCTVADILDTICATSLQALFKKS